MQQDISYSFIITGVPIHLLWQTVSVQSCQKSSSFLINNHRVQKSETTFKVSCERGYNQKTM